MATIPTATIIPGPKYTLSPAGVASAQGLFILGNTDADNQRVGCYAIDFRMTNDWVGTIAIMARSGIHKAGVDDIALLGPWPFRAFYFNGAPWDGTMVSGLTGPAPLITATSNIEVPGYGQTIGLSVSCTAGSCTLYYVPLVGPSVV